MDRRAFIQRMIGLGLTAPMANQLLAIGGVAMAQSRHRQADQARRRRPAEAAVVAGADPAQSAFCHRHQGPGRFTPVLRAARLLGRQRQSEPVLAAEIPSIQNGGLSTDAKSVTWKLKPGVKWHDGKPFTADDVVFNWESARDPATAAVTIGIHREITVEKVDDLTVRILFNKPTLFWAEAFVGVFGAIIPKHLFADYKGDKSRDAPNNLKPVGTGPYKFLEFKPGDLIRGEINPDYHMPNRPYFDTVEMKGGGDAVSAARAVIQTGEYDFGYLIQVEDDVLSRLEKGGKGKTIYAVGGDTEFIALNFTDPYTEIDGERSSIKTKHPLFSDPAVRKALALLVDRESIKKSIYGRAGRITPNFLNGPEQFVSKNTSREFNIEKAAKLLDDAGWKPGADGIREKDGKRLKLLYQTSINGPRQKTQAIVKQACQKAGIEVELKSVVASVFFSSDVGNPDTYAQFYADIEMFQIPMTQPDPAQHMRRYHSRYVASKENKWGAPISRAMSTRITTRWSMRPRPRSIRSSARPSTSRPTTCCCRIPCSSP